MKKYTETAMKTFFSFLIIFFIIYLMNFSGFKELLLQNKKIKTDVNEGKYILSRLADKYEEYLKSRRADLQKETKSLSKDKAVINNINERQKIEERLKEIDKEKNTIDRELKDSIQEKSKIEEKVANIKNEQELFRKKAMQLDDEYAILLEEKENDQTYWKNYSNDLQTFFIEKNKKDPAKKAFVKKQFQIENGKQFIIDEFSNLSKLKEIELAKKAENKANDKMENKKGSQEKSKVKKEEIAKIENKNGTLEKSFSYFSENFESLPIDAIPNGWKIINGDSKTYVGVVDSSSIEPFSSPKCLKLYDGSNKGDGEVQINIDGAGNYGQLKLNFYSKSSNSNSRFSIYLYGSSGKKILNVHFNYRKEINIGEIKASHEEHYINNIGTFNFDQWNIIQIKWDINTGYFNINFNNQDFGNYKLLNSDTVDNIQLESGEINKSKMNDSTVFIDDIKFTANKETISANENKIQKNENLTLNNTSIFLKPEATDGRDASKLIEDVFGKGSAVYSKQNPNILHMTEVNDNETGSAFKFVLHKDIDRQSWTTRDKRYEGMDYARARITTNYNSSNIIKAFKNDTVRYSWKFKIGNDFTVPINSYAILFELYRRKFNLEILQFVAIKNQNKDDIFRLVFYSPDYQRSIIGTSIYTIDREKWYEAECTVNFNEKGTIKLLVKDLKEKVIMSIDLKNMQFWQTDLDCIFPYFGINKNYIHEEEIIKNNEEAVYFTDIGIQKIK